MYTYIPRPFFPNIPDENSFTTKTFILFIRRLCFNVKIFKTTVTSKVNGRGSATAVLQPNSKRINLVNLT